VKGIAQDRLTAQQMLQHWQQDSDLASLRDKAVLAKLPKAEQEAWQKLWVEVDALVKKASARKKGLEPRKP
jgi:hypothetical protein